MAIPSLTIGTDLDIILANDPSRVSFYHEDATIIFQSPWTGTEQRQRRWGRWHARMEWTLMNRRQYYAIARFFSKYNMGEAFRFYDPVRSEPDSDLTPTVLSSEVGATGIKVNGANQTGRTLLVRDVPNRAASVALFRAGDLIGFKDTGQMFEIFADVMGTSATTASIQLCQYIRKSPTDGELIFVTFVPCRMRLASPIAPDVNDGPAQFAFSVELVEALP